MAEGEKYMTSILRISLTCTSEQILFYRQVDFTYSLGAFIALNYDSAEAGNEIYC